MRMDLPPERAQVRMTPEELNQTSDEKLFGIIDSAMGVANDGASIHGPLAPYITLELLWRVHSRVVILKSSGVLNSAKHKLFARAVLSLTGVPTPPDERDVDKIGNHLDIWLQRRYLEVDRRCKRNIRNIAAREEQRAALRLQCCEVTGWGGVQAYYFMPDAEGDRVRTCVRAPYVPYRRQLTPAAMTLMELKAEVNQARSDIKSTTADLEREKERASTAKRRREEVEAEKEAAEKLAAMAVKEKLEVEKQSAKRLKAQADYQRAECRRIQRKSELAIRDMEARVMRLSSQAAAHAQDAAVHAQREAKIQDQLHVQQELAEAECDKLREEAVRARSEVKSVRRDAAQALRDAEAKLLRLGSQAAARSQEAAAHAHEKMEAQQRLEEEQARLELELDKLREEKKTLRSEMARKERDASSALLDAEAKVLRLGSQAAARAQEAAIHAQNLDKELRHEKERQEELREAQETSDFYRQKAAREASTRRERDKFCMVVIAQKEAVKQTSQKRLQARKELEDELVTVREEYDSVREELDNIRSRGEENAGAAEKLDMMPTWRHVRNKTGKRGGGLQLEHQHRVAILEQHANGTPASAIGKNIVSTVKLAAPWLNPIEPSTGEIRQIGFELTTLVEALAARKTAGAYEVKLLGFDETTDRFKPVLTSNVQVRDTEGAPLDDVILKAAYLSTKGGESDAIVSEIEDKCFSRLRVLLRL